MATLFYGLIKNHPFHDCNKRTAMLSILHYLFKIKRMPIVKHKELETLTIRVAENDLKNFKEYQNFKKLEDRDIRFIADFFKRNSRAINKRFYLITYRQLNTKLSKFGYRLDNPHKNYIDIIRETKKRRFFVLGQKVRSDTKVGMIGFPGWTKEVARKDMDSLRKFTGLTVNDGFDSDVFYRGSESLKSLIDEYSGLLKRLANK